MGAGLGPSTAAGSRPRVETKAALSSQVSCRRLVTERPESTSRMRSQAPATSAEPPAPLKARASIEVKQLTQMPPDSTGARAPA